MPGDPRLLVRVRVAGESSRPRLDVDLAFRPGITAIVGPSGAGKSTLLATIAGLVVPEAGRITLGDVELFDGEGGRSVPAHRRRIALVFQSLALFPHLRAWENVAYGLRSTTRARRREVALRWLVRAKVEHLADRWPSSLSGGEAQRVAIARALASEPHALLLDEPFSALDRGLRVELGAEIQALVDEIGIVALWVTHHEQDAMTIGSAVVGLREGVSVGVSGGS